MMKDRRNNSMYGKALREVYEVIDNMSVEDTKIISSAFLNKLYKAADWSYDFQYDKSKSFDEQKLSDDSKAILGIIYMRYFATIEEKAELYRLIKEN